MTVTQPGPDHRNIENDDLPSLHELLSPAKHGRSSSQTDFSSSARAKSFVSGPQIVNGIIESGGSGSGDSQNESLYNPQAADIENDKGGGSGDDKDEGSRPARRQKSAPRGNSISHHSLSAQQGDIANEDHDRIICDSELDALGEEGDVEEEESDEDYDKSEGGSDYVDSDGNDEDPC
jgi:hypothetical protein